MNLLTKVKVAIIIKIILFLSIKDLISNQNDIWDGKIEVKDGITYILNSDVPIKKGNDVIFEKDLEIGLEEESEKYIFGLIYDIEVDNKGNIYILDNPNYQVKKFTPSGKFIQSFGRKGGGPGEFINPKDFTIVNDSIIVVLDLGNRRFTFFNLQCNYLGDFKLKIEFPNVPDELKSNLMGDAFIKYIGLNFYPIKSIIDIKKIIVEKKKFLDKVKIERDSPPRGYFSLNNIGTQDPLKFDFANIWCIDSQGNIYFADKNYDYSIKVYNPEGKLFKCIKRKFDILKLSKQEISETLKEYNESTKILGGKFSENNICKIHEVIYDIWIDDNDRLWVRTSKRGHTKSIVFNIFDKNGRFLKEAILESENGSLFLIKNDYLYFKKVNSNGIHYAARYKILEK